MLSKSTSLAFSSSFVATPLHPLLTTSHKTQYRHANIYRASVTPTDPPSVGTGPKSKAEKRILETCTPPPWMLSFRGQRLYEMNHEGLQYQVLPPSKKGDNRSNSEKSPWRRLLDLTLLPANFPHSVGRGYGQWVIWHVGRQMFRNAYYVLGTTSLLKALGLGSGQAIAVGASLKWVLKDGLGMASKLGVSARLAGIVDRDPKMWRVIGDSLMAVAVGVEICSVLKPAYFLLFGALGSLLKEAAGAMSGPSYRVFLYNFAVRENIGDVSSRGEAQVVLGNLLGLGIGVLVSAELVRIEGGLAGTLGCFAVLAALHMRCTLNAVRTVDLNTLNWKRLNIVLDAFLDRGEVLSVEEVNEREGLLERTGGDRIRMGVSLAEYVDNDVNMETILGNGEDRFIVVYSEGTVGVLLREDVEMADMLRAILQGKKLLERVDAEKRNMTAEGVKRLTRESHEWAGSVLGQLVSGLETRGWSTGKLLISLGNSRYKEASAA